MSACRHVSHSEAGSRGGDVPNPRHCTKIPPGGRQQDGGSHPLGMETTQLNSFDNPDCDLVTKG